MNNSAVPSPVAKGLKNVTKHHSASLAPGEQLVSYANVVPVGTPQLAPAAMMFGLVGALIGHALAKGPAEARARALQQHLNLSVKPEIPEGIKKGCRLALTNQRLLLLSRNNKQILATLDREDSQLDVFTHGNGFRSLIFQAADGRMWFFTTLRDNGSHIDHMVTSWQSRQAVLAA